ncbi:MAG: MBOAT family O-acyltransferase [Eubacteriales bacterium]
MLFNSIDFLVFFAAVFIIYYVFPIKARWLVLLGASIYFYASWNVSYLILIFCTVAISYSAARLIETAKTRRRMQLLLAIAVIASFNLLVMFKYYNFIASLTGGLLPFISVLLPVGISFYTFQSISYVIDVYRGIIKAERNLLYYTLFVMFFPQLVAGPIERAGDLIPQLHLPLRFDYRRAVEGSNLVIWGLFKKCLIADSLCVAADAVYGNIAMQSSVSAVLGTLFFAFQIFCDFSGYSDIAVGIGKILGYELTINFRSPYLARNIDDFWARWHITLSRWFRDYLYIPLGGNRKGAVITCINLFVTFLISGLWHGANITFIIWGAYHGVLTVLYRLVKKPLSRLENKFSKPLSVLSNIFCRLVTFAAVTFGWIFFRSHTFSDAKTIIGKIFEWNGAGVTDSIIALGINTTVLYAVFCAVLLMILIEYFRFEHQLFERFAALPMLVRTPVCLVFAFATLTAIMYFSGGDVKPFVYFQF